MKSKLLSLALPVLFFVTLHRCLLPIVVADDAEISALANLKDSLKNSNGDNEDDDDYIALKFESSSSASSVSKSASATTTTAIGNKMENQGDFLPSSILTFHVIPGSQRCFFSDFKEKRLLHVQERLTLKGAWFVTSEASLAIDITVTNEETKEVLHHTSGQDEGGFTVEIEKPFALYSYCFSDRRRATDKSITFALQVLSTRGSGVELEHRQANGDSFRADGARIKNATAEYIKTSIANTHRILTSLTHEFSLVLLRIEAHLSLQDDSAVSFIAVVLFLCERSVTN